MVNIILTQSNVQVLIFKEETNKKVGHFYTG